MEFWLKIISAVSSLGVTSLWFQWGSQRRQRRLDNFHRYASRYEELFSEIVRLGPLDRPFQPQSERDRALVIKLFMLYSEEFYLGEEKRLLDQRAWLVWRSGIEYSMRYSYFRDAWHFCRSQMDLEGSFAMFVDDAIAKTPLRSPDTLAA